MATGKTNAGGVADLAVTTEKIAKAVRMMDMFLRPRLI